MPHTKIQARKRGASSGRLNPQQQIFVQALLVDKEMNPTAAARIAGYKNPSSAGNKLMNNKVVQAIAGKALTARLNEPDVSHITAIRVLQELGNIGFSNIKQLFDDSGLLIPINELPDSVASAISSIDVETRYEGEGDDVKPVTVTKIKLWPKNNALELIAKHLGMLETKLKIEHGLDKDMSSALSAILFKVQETKQLNVIDAKFIEHKTKE